MGQEPVGVPSETVGNVPSSLRPGPPARRAAVRSSLRCCLRYCMCPVRDHSRQDYIRNYDAPTCRVKQVGAGAWGWVKEMLTDPRAFARGLREYRQRCDEENEPLRTRLAVVDDLLADSRAQLGRLLDLYLPGGFSEEMLTDRKCRLEKTILALE